MSSPHWAPSPSPRAWCSPSSSNIRTPTGASTAHNSHSPSTWSAHAMPSRSGPSHCACSSSRKPAAAHSRKPGAIPPRNPGTGTDHCGQTNCGRHQSHRNQGRRSHRSACGLLVGLVVDQALTLSGEIGMSMLPSSILIGPAAVGLMSNSKISVGSHKVAHAFGTSTTPLMWPCTGAVPRIE